MKKLKKINITPSIIIEKHPSYSIAEKQNPPFLKRIVDINRKTIPDWEGQGITTHKLGWMKAEQNGEPIYVVYPNVQEINGELHDFTDPKYNQTELDAYKNAVKNNNVIIFNKPEFADFFTKNYKEHYKGFDKYQNGGNFPKLKIIK